MSMNNDKQVLDLGDVAGFDEFDDSSGLGDMYVTQPRSAEDYKLNDAEDFASYISRTSTDAVEGVIEDNLIAKYLRSQGTPEADIKDQAFIDEEGNKTSIFDLDKSAQKQLLKSLTTELGGNTNKQVADDTLIIDEDDDIAAILEAYQAGDIEGVVDLLKVNGYVDMERAAAESLSDEEVLFIHAKNTCPDCDDDEIEDFVSKVKSGSQKKKIIEGVRNKLIEIDKQVKEQESFQLQQEMLQEAQQSKKSFMQNMTRLDNIYGFENDSDIVSDVSSYLYDYDEDYDTTPFYRDLATDPELRYKVAFFAKYGDQVIEQLQDKAKQAYNEGKKSVLGQLPTKGKSSFGTFTSMSGKGKGKAPDLGDI